MNRKLGVVIAALVAIGLVVGGYVYWNSRTPEKVAIEESSVRLAWVYDMAEAGIFVAADRGYFKEHGLDMTIEPGGFGLDPIKLVAAGTNEFGVAGAGNVLLARAQGVPVVAIAAEFQNTPVGFVVREDSGIANFTDFRGKRIGIQTGADTDVLYRALLARNRMTSDDVREVPIQFDMTPFVSGQIDVLPGYVTNQPVTLRSKGFKVGVLSAASQGLDYYGNVYIVSEKTLAEHPERVRAFLSAVRQGWETALSDKAGTVASVQSRSEDFNVEDLNAIYDAVMPFIRSNDGPPLMSMTRAKWSTTRQVLVDAGLLSTDLDLDAAFTTRFIDEP